MKSRKKHNPAAPALASIPAPAAGRHKPGPRGRVLFAGLALGLLTIAAFSNSFATGFVLDNQMLLLGDPRIRSASVENLSLILQHTYWWPNGEAGIYRPLTTLSYLFNYSILGNGNNPAGYHWVNFIFHFANVLLVFALARRLLTGRARAFRLAIFIAILWAVHPVLTESVTNIAGRADLFAATAVLSGFLMYLKSCETTGWNRIPWLAGLAAASAAGAFSKESAVVLPGIIVLYELVCRGKGIWSRAFPWAKVAWGFMAAGAPIGAMLWQRAIVLSASVPAEFPFVDNPIVGAGFWIGRLTAIKVLARYLWITVWPARLSCDYSYSEIPLATGSPGDWAAWLVVAAALVLMVLLYKRDRTAFFFAGLGFLNLLPAANLLFPIGTIMAERLLYLPLFGLVGALVVAADDAGVHLRVPGWVPVVLVCLMGAGLAVRTWVRNLDWKDDLAMATASVRTSPGSFKVHRLLANALFQSDPAHGDIDRVVAEAHKSLAILHALPDQLSVFGVWNLAANCHLAKGDALPEADARREYEEAIRIARRSIAIEAAAREAYDRRHGVQLPVPPNAADGYRILATAHLRLRQAGQALPPAMQARTINPASVEVYPQIADAYLAQGRGEDAAIALAEGMFATGDASLRQDLLQIYQSGVDANGCAVVPGPRGPALNPSCAIVHRNLCEGAARAHRQDLWQQLQCQH
jgi:hypothetical protein